MGSLSAMACAAVGDVDKPPPPDMSALVTIYEAPPGRLTDEDTATLLAAVVDQAELVDELDLESALLDDLFEELDEALGGAEATAAVPRLGSLPRVQAVDLTGDGYVRATRVCNGWGPEPVPDRANGTLRLTAGFTEAGLDPVIWGTLARCKYVAAGRELLISGDGESSLAVYIGQGVQATDLTSQPLLIDVDASGTIDGEARDLDLDFRLLQGGRLELRTPATDGDVIVTVAPRNADEPVLIESIRTRDGLFECTTSGRCANGDGRSLQL